MLGALFGVDNARDIPKIFPGLALCLILMATSIQLSTLAGEQLLRWQGTDPTGRSSPLSAVLVAILLGAFLTNLTSLPALFSPGIQFAVKKLLRLGIILIGIKLSLLEVAQLGLWGVPIVLAAIVTGLTCISWFNRKLGLPPRLGTLIAAGTSICGVTAVVSTAPAIEAEEKEVSYAVANVTCFGLIGMVVYPYLAPYLFETSEQIGLFLGTAIHDTAQVMGAALTCKEVFGDDIAFTAATVTKMTRNLFLAVVVPYLAWSYARENKSDGEQVSWTKLIPFFVVGFLAMSFLRTVGDAYPLMAPERWKALHKLLGDFLGAKVALGTAMAGVGLGTKMSVFKGVGAKPFLVGLAGALIVGLVGLALALTLGQWVHLTG